MKLPMTISNTIYNGVRRGVCISFAENAGKIVGEIHCYPPTPRTLFAQRLVRFDDRSRSRLSRPWRGSRDLHTVLETVQQTRPEILRVELIARESNQKAIAFYQSLGLRHRRRNEGRIHRPDGEFEADIPMAWSRS